MLEELKIKHDQSMLLFSDNKATIEISRNPVQHDRTKHVEVDSHFIKEKIESGVLTLSYVSTKKQVANILIKGLARSVFDHMINKLGMTDIYCPA